MGRSQSPLKTIGVRGVLGAFAILFVVGAGFMAADAATNLAVGEPAPLFSGVDTAGATHNLADYLGKKVVLEWTNHDCPYVRKHYDPSHANMQGLQARAAGEDIIWLTIISSAPGKQGHVSPDEADQLTSGRGAAPSAVILDTSGDIGRMYSARTTPHMYVIDEQGDLQYMGAIDDKRSTNPGHIPTSTNYVGQALDELAQGGAISVQTSQPYGCSVKYGS